MGIVADDRNLGRESEFCRNFVVHFEIRSTTTKSQKLHRFVDIKKIACHVLSQKTIFIGIYIRI